MNFKDAVQTCFRKYADFNGRARRSEYWYFFLFCFAVLFAASLLTGSLGAGKTSKLVFIIELALAVPSIAASWRRLHDVGKSGWLTLLSLVPIAGLYVIYLTVKDSQPGTNEFGPNPKEEPFYNQ